MLPGKLRQEDGKFEVPATKFKVGLDKLVRHCFQISKYFFFPPANHVFVFVFIYSSLYLNIKPLSLCGAPTTSPFFKGTHTFSSEESGLSAGLGSTCS